jgi:alpha/beta superfamily hydrolase
VSDVVLPGGRDVRGTLDQPDDGDADTIVVACPPHPQDGGTRSDQRLTAVSDALRENEIACLRFDYGDWDEGHGEQEDVKNAVEWAHEQANSVGLFGFSFGATMTLLAATDLDDLQAVCALAPDSGQDDLDAVAALDDIEFPTKILYAERDDTADWEPVIERANELDIDVEGLSADHFFLGQEEKVGERVGAFFDDRL